MKLILALSILAMAATILRIKSEQFANWMVVSDTVMGGKSFGSVTFVEDYAVFEGNISLENNGGFSSFRSPFKDFDLTDYKKVVITYRNSGKQFAFSLENSRQWFEPNYKYTLPDSEGEWVTKEFKLSDMKAYQIGRALNYKLDKTQLHTMKRMGFINVGKEGGEFQLDVKEIRFE